MPWFSWAVLFAIVFCIGPAILFASIHVYFWLIARAASLLP